MKVDDMAEVATMPSGGLSKSAPVAIGAGVSGITFFGYPLPDFVPLLTCIYLAVMIAHTAYKFYLDWRNAKGRDDEKKNRG